MDTDQVNEIEDLSDDTINSLVQRIERSNAVEQLIYRESEIDELWRLLGGVNPAANVAEANGANPERIRALRAVIMEVHDLIGVDENPAAAAAKLRAALA